MAVPYTFATATSAIPLSQLDNNFATAITMGNTAVQLGNTITTLNNMTLANVTVSSGNVAVTTANATTINATTLNAATHRSDTSLTLQTNGTTTAVTIGTDQNATFAGYINAPNSFGFKNRIINGAMVIDQRNAGASVTPTDQTYSLDRWKCRLSQASKYTVQQNAGSVTPPSGYKNYLGVTVAAAANVTIGAGDFFAVEQILEGYNISDLDFGLSTAKAFTISFWVRSSVTGTYGGALNNSAENRPYGFTYTISAANTWEQKSITITADTAGTWLSTNGIGLYVIFNLGTGSTYGSATNGSWASGATQFTPTGCATPITTNSATFYITGVQLEKGSTATSFDYRPYGTELSLCQRYLPAFNASAADYAIGLSGQVYSTTQALIAYPFIVQPRTAPTGITVSNGAHFSLTTATATRSTTSSVTFNNGTLLGGVLTATISLGLIAGNSTLLWSSNASAQILWTGCEL